MVPYTLCCVTEWIHKKILNANTSENNIYRNVLLTFPWLMAEIWHDGNLHNEIQYGIVLQ
jgi:hypothetical protein